MTERNEDGTVEAAESKSSIFHSPYQNAKNMPLHQPSEEFHYSQQDERNEEHNDDTDSPLPPLGLHYRRRHHQYHHLQIESNNNNNDNNSHHQCQPPLPLPLHDPWAYISLIRHLYMTSCAIILSNMLEWLDFSIFGYSESEISRQLFGGNTTFGWMTFGLGYLMRPIGAYILGRVADDKTGNNRKVSLFLAVIGMSISTATMAIIPPFCDASDEDLDNQNNKTSFLSFYCVDGGIWKTTLPVVIMRCIQGFSAGGAAGGVNVIQSELRDETQSVIAQSVGINNVSGSAASMLSAGIVFGLRAIIGGDKYEIWGWRLAFLIVVPPSAISAFLLIRNEEEEGQNIDGSSTPSLFHHVDNNESTPPPQLPSSKMNNVYIHYTASELDGSDGDKHVDCHNNDDGSIQKEDVFQDEHTTDNIIINSNNVSNHDYYEAPSPDEICADNTSNRNNNSVAAVPFWLLISVSIYIQFAISSYNNLNIYMVQYAKQHYHLSAEYATLMAVFGKAVQLLVSPFAALLADIIGWFGACSIGGILCCILAVPMMAANQIHVNFGGDSIPGDDGGGVDDGTGSGGNRIDPVLWILVCGVFPIVSTIWILNAPLLATSIFPKETRSQGTSMVMAIGTAIAGFFPLLLNEVTSIGTSSSNNDNDEIDSSRMYISGSILAAVAALGTIGILWIRNHAKKGRIQIYQRHELF